MWQEFIFCRDDPSLRNLVAQAERALGPGMEYWGRFFALFDHQGQYACIGLGVLSGELESRTWRLDTRIDEFSWQACATQRAGSRTPDLRANFVVAEEDGRPIGLDLVGATPAGLNRTGWWRLVGAYAAEQGTPLAWPADLPDEYRLDPVVQIEAETTLADLGRLLGRRAYPDSAVLAIQGTGPGDWALYTVGELGREVAAARPQPAANSHVGAVVDLGSASTPTLRREQTPWPLVLELFKTDMSIALIVEDGRPASVLSLNKLWRSGASGRDATPGPDMASSPETVPSPDVAFSPDEAAPTAKGPSVAHLLSQLPESVPEQQAYGRVVNSWFAGEDRQRIDHTVALAANRVYLLGVNVGDPDVRSHHQGEQPAFDAQVIRYALAEGTPLVLRLHSEDFIVLDRSRPLDLPRTGRTADLFFRIATPVNTGVCHLTLDVYVKNNLVQSFRVSARVAPQQGAIPASAVDGWWSQCEYTLSAGLGDLDALALRRVSLWIGKKPEGPLRAAMTHAASAESGATFEINPLLIERALQRYREILYHACYRQTGPGSFEYQYHKDHTPIEPQATFVDSVKQLAELGQNLYQRVFGDRSDPVLDELRAAEPGRDEPLVLQIARLSLDITFPWAVLYDYPLDYNPFASQVCTRFLSGGCADDCPLGTDRSVICPYGFWGFRHIIEQPLVPSGLYSSVVTRLEADGPLPLTVVCGAGLELSAHHRQRVEAMARHRAQAAFVTTSRAALDALEEGSPLIYFYCHGGSTEYRQWLQIGEQDVLMPAHLKPELRQRWRPFAGQRPLGEQRSPARQRPRAGQRSTAPLVVLNGCHTGQFDPATPLSFVHQFGNLGAAGLIGTEIPIHEYLGNTFGLFLFARLLGKEPVGQTVYEFRRKLLQQQNVLGLVYVPYCYADLRFA